MRLFPQALFLWPFQLWRYNAKHGVEPVLQMDRQSTVSVLDRLRGKSGSKPRITLSAFMTSC